MAYTPIDSKMVVVSFTGAYAALDERLIRIDLTPPDTGTTRTVYPGAVGDYGAGHPTVRNVSLGVRATGVDASIVSTPSVVNARRSVPVSGADHLNMGTPGKVWNFHSFFRASGKDSRLFGATAVHNQHEYLRTNGFVATGFGATRIEPEDRRRHALRYLNYFNKGVPSVSGGPRTVFHSDSYVFVATSFSPVSPTSDFLIRFDRQTWQTDEVERVVSDPVSGDIIKPSPEFGFTNVAGGMLMPCYARRADNSSYVGLLQLTSDGTYVAHSNLGLGDIYAFAAVGNRVYFTHGQTDMLYGGAGVNASPLVSAPALSTRLAANSTALFVLDITTDELKRLDLDTGLPIATVSVTPSTNVLAVTEHVVWVVDGTATAYAYDLSLTPLNEVSIAAFEPSGSTPACSVPEQRPQCSENLAAIDTSHGTVLLYGSADRHTVAGYLPVAQGGVVSSTQLWPPPYALPEQYMAFPATPWPPNITRPPALSTSNLALHQKLGNTRLMSDTEAYLSMTLAQRVQPGGAGYIPPEWQLIGEWITKASVNVSSVITYAANPVGIAPPAPAFGVANTWLQRRYVYPATGSHRVVGEPYVQLQNRAVFPATLYGASFGTITLRDNKLRPDGFDAAEVPQVFVTDLRQFIYPLSVAAFDVWHVGDPDIRNFNKIVVPDTADHASFNSFHPTVRNARKQAKPLGADHAVASPVSVRNAALVFRPSGWGSLTFGVTDVDRFNRMKQVYGSLMTVFGDVSVFNLHLGAAPAGFQSPVFGDPHTAHRVRPVYPDGITPTQISEVTVELARRYVPVAGRDSLVFGITQAAYKYRRVYIPHFSADKFGATDVMLQRRMVYPEGVFFDTPGAAFGVLRTSYRLQPIVAGCGDQSRFGVVDIWRNEQLVWPLTFGALSPFGYTDVSHRHRRRAVEGFKATLAGEGSVWHWRTYCTTWSPLMPDVFGVPGVTQRNKTVRPAGYDMAFVSHYYTILNAGRALLPTGTDSALFGGVMIAPRIRTVVPEGGTLGAVGRWTAVWNLRQVLPDKGGIARPYAGLPTVWRNERLIYPVSAPPPTEPSQVFVADRVRTIVVARYDVPYIAPPYIGLYIQRVYPVPFGQDRYGNLFVESKRNIAGAHGYPQDRYGAPTVKNFNPQAWVVGFAPHPDYYGPWVSFRVRGVDIGGAGIPAAGVGAPSPTLRNRTIRPGGVTTDSFSRLLEVKHDEPQLPNPQRCIAGGIGVTDIPPVTINRRSALMVGEDMSQFGRLVVTSNGVLVNSSLGDSAKTGDPWVSFKHRTILANTEEYPLVFGPSRVFMFPAVLGPFGDIRVGWLVDAHLAKPGQEGVKPVFGEPDVSNQHRAVRDISILSPDPGIPTVSTNKISVTGWDANRRAYGMVEVRGPQYIAPYWGRITDDYMPDMPQYSFETALFGEPVTEHYTPPPVWSPYLTPTGFSATGFGYSRVENLIRRIYPSGNDSLHVPPVWAHPPFRLNPQGIEPPEITITQIAYRHRTLSVEGEDMALVCREDVSAIKHRLYVRHGISRYAVVGIPALPVVIAQVSYRIRTVIARSVAAPAPALTRPRVEARFTVSPVSFDAALVGAPSRAVYGMITPYAQDMTRWGRYRIDRSVGAAGIAPLPPAGARIGRPIRPAGVDCSGYEPPAVTNIYGCRDRVVIVTGETDFSTFGASNVTH